MFTGLVESTGTVVLFRRRGDLYELSIRSEALAGSLLPGQSVAVSGACLTVSSRKGILFSADVLPETVKKTKFSTLRPGGRVNLERALSAQGRFDGHMVTGHIDGTALVEGISRGREGHILTLRIPDDLGLLVVPRGSIAVDGVSLTVADFASGVCRISIIPTTLEATTLGELKTGDRVNIETDILGKYVFRYFEGTTGAPRP